MRSSSFGVIEHLNAFLAPYDPRILSCTLLSVRFLDSIAPTRKARTIILPKAFAVKQVSLKNVQSKA